MGNLLAYNESFKWEDTKIDRGIFIQNLNEVILESKDYDDLYKSDKINNINLNWGNFLDFILGHGHDEEIRIKTFPWMTQLQHQTLLQIIISFKNSIEIIHDDLADFKRELKNDECELIGFKDSDMITEHVSCSMSYRNFHSKIVKNYNRDKRNNNKKYFIKFFKPELNTTLGNIRNQISRRQCPEIIERLDSPSTDPKGNILHGEKHQIHFKNGTCLNIDGIWKHGSFIVPSDVCDKLIEWGFVLPENLEN